MRRAGEVRPALRIFSLAASLLILFAGSIPVRAGHELPYYPSFYPHEIQLTVSDAGGAAEALRTGLTHATPGTDPFGGALPPQMAAAASWGGYVVLTFSREAIHSIAPAQRCVLARDVARRLDRTVGGFVVYPYPVTPYHGDYLYHYDRAVDAQRAVAADATTAWPTALTIDASGTAARLMPGAPVVVEGGGQAVLEEVRLDSLVPETALPLAGRPAPPWSREGWFHAYRLMAGAVSDPQVRTQAAGLYHRLTAGATATVEERVNLERQLVSLLRSTCERVVLGYTVRREPFTTDFSNGIDNVGYDGQTGLNSAIFFRTVRLKDFPWNGVLRMRISAAATAAWNPLAGFADAFGRMLWEAVGDPALLPAPYRSGWMANRVTWTMDVVDRVPAGALMPGSDGRWRPVSPRAQAAVKITYTLRPSDFHDGTTMTAADAIYPYISAFATADRAVAAATAPMRAALAGLRVAGITKITKQLWGVDLAWQAPVIEVYLRHFPRDAEQAAALAPAWSAVPWTVLTLMEEAARRGLAALSEAEAASRGLPWLDVVRDRGMNERLLGLVDAFAAQDYRPAGLEAFVTPAEAGARWRALRAFYLARGHWLVTNGPYQLTSWTDHGAILTVFRDLSYPLTLGTYDRYAIPHHGYVTTVTNRPGQLEVGADLERVVRFSRSFEIVREPLGKPPSPEQAFTAVHDGKPQCHYVVVRADGQIIASGRIEYAAGNAFTLQIPERLARSSVILTIVVAENETVPAVTMVALPRR